MLYRIIAIILLCTACGQLPGSSNDSGSSTEITDTTASDTRSMALDSKDDLPECTESNNKQLIYVIDEEQFYTCNDAEWAAIDVGPEQLDDNHFLDKITGYLWQVGGVVSWTPAKSGCTGDWKFPDSETAKAAVIHGIDAGGDGVWYSTSMKYISAAGVDSTEAGATKHLAVCYRE
jgi:hypothetical protein